MPSRAPALRKWALLRVGGTMPRRLSHRCHAARVGRLATPFRLTSVNSVTCHPDAVCSNAACVCGPNYYGDGYSCTRKEGVPP